MVSFLTSQKKFLLLLGLSFLYSNNLPKHGNAHSLKNCKFDQIYQFGDSISDTGNRVREFPDSPCARLPYGETFFKNATGRCSNGLLMIDYIAIDAGLPFLPPYKDIDANFRNGVNFAVGGSTALPSEVLATRHIFSLATSSLGVQLDWMRNYLHSICLDGKDCFEKLKTALFIVGEIGQNDYNYAFIQLKTMDEVKSMVPEVVNTIIHAVKMVISFGATRVVVPGEFPIGCLPFTLTTFTNNSSEAYDENQCLKQFNDLAKYHNEQLQQALHTLRQETTNTIIVYGDYYNAYLFLLRFAKSRGYDTQRACCGIGGKYNYDLARMCGVRGVVPVCKNPNSYVNWDGVHFTQEAYKVMAGWFLHDIFGKLHCHF